MLTTSFLFIISSQIAVQREEGTSIISKNIADKTLTIAELEHSPFSAVVSEYFKSHAMLTFE